MPIKRRDVLVLVSVWFMGCIVVAGLIGFFYASSSPETADQPRLSADFVIPFDEHSAKKAYLSALAEAQAWQSDVELIAVSTHWTEATIESLGQAQVWDYRFFSPTRRRIFFVIARPDQQLNSQAHLYKLDKSPYLVDPAAWLIDSDEALRLWTNQGGGVFLENFPGSRVEALLRQTPARPTPVWNIIGVSPDQSQIFYLTIDASDGQILN